MHVINQKKKKKKKKKICLKHFIYMYLVYSIMHDLAFNHPL